MVWSIFFKEGLLSVISCKLLHIWKCSCVYLVLEEHLGWTYNSQLTFLSQNPVDFAILSSSTEFFLRRFLRTIWHLSNSWLLFLSRHSWKSSAHLCFNNFTRIYLSVDYNIMFVLDNMYSLHLKIQVFRETAKKPKTHRGWVTCSRSHT